MKFIRPEIIAIAELTRAKTGAPVTINNWATGGNYSESGLRTFSSSTGAAWSLHKWGAAIDVKVKGLSTEKVFKIIFENESAFFAEGARRIEDIAFTPTWLHIDCGWTGADHILIIKP